MEIAFLVFDKAGIPDWSLICEKNVQKSILQSYFSTGCPNFTDC